MPQTIKPATPLPYAVESGALYQPNTERIYATDPGPELDFSVAFVFDVDTATRAQDAAYIVTACNAYPRLVEALRYLVNPPSVEAKDATPEHVSAILNAFDNARNLLRELGGE